MKPRRLLPWLLSLLLLCGCAPEVEAPSPSDVITPSPTPTQTVRASDFCLPAFTDLSFHPLTGTSSTNLTLAPLMFESLFALTEDFTATPQLCASYEVSEDFTQWRFSLIETSFSDGTALTAQHVVSSLLLSQSAGNRYAARLNGAQIFADGNVVCINLSAPCSGLPELLDIPVVLGTGDRPLGTGAYALVERGSELCLSLRPDWRGEKPSIEVIALRTLIDYPDLLSAFDAGNFSLVNTDLTAASALGFSGNYEKIDYLTTQMIYLGYQTTSGILRDQNLRLAISQYLNRDDICKQTLASHAQATALPVNPQSARYPIAAEPDWSAEDSAALLDAAGYPLNEDGRRASSRGALSLRLLVCNENPNMHSVANAIAKQLDTLGLTVTVVGKSFADYSAALSKGDFDLYLAQVQLTANDDLSALISGSLNYGNYTSHAARNALADYLAAPEQLREGTLALLCQILLEDQPFTPIGFKYHSVLFPWGSIRGVSPVQGNIFSQFNSWIFS